MNLKTVASLSSALLFLLAALLLVPFALALYDDTERAALAYGVSAAVTVVAALALRFSGRGAPATLHRKDALGVVALIWLCSGTFGALPFVIEGSIVAPAAALFEAVSGFTTTGATVVGDIDGLSRATNLWRCLMHWVGGMGIVVLFIAVFPQLGVGAKHLFKTEVPGPITEGLRPKIKQTALTLWWIYTGLTLTAGVLLWLCGLPIFDAVCHALSTLATGGFSNHTRSVGAFESATVHWIIIAFMLIGALNFGLYHGLLRGRVRDILRDYETRFYLLVNALVITIVFFSTRGRYPDALSTLRHAAFQTTAVTTTTGYMTADYDTYPDVARFALFLCMFMGGCAGSTAAGIKASRVYALIKLAGRSLRNTVQPQAVVAVRVGRTALSEGVIDGILIFVTTYFLIFAVASLIMVGLGLDLVSAMSSVVACLSNIGPGLGAVGPTQNYDFVPAAGKLVLSACMIIGRLEIFAFFAVFTPEAWRR